MKYTHLEMVQLVLSSLDSDEVNSINDTTESTQVSNIIRTAFYDLFPHLKIMIHSDLFQLEASGDNTKPVLMTKPTDVHSVEWIKYDKQLSTDTDANFQYVHFLPLAQFLEITDGLKPSDTTVDSFTQTIGSASVVFNYKNNVAPTYYTTYDDETVIFDSYDNTVDTTLQKSKTRCYGEIAQTYTLSDNFTPPLNDREFSLLLNEAKSLAYAELKQSVHAKAEMNSRKGIIRTKKEKRNIPSYVPELWTMPDYGRRPAMNTPNRKPKSWST